MAKNTLEQRDLNEKEELCLINCIIDEGKHWRKFLSCYNEPKDGNQSHPGGSVYGLMQGKWKNAVRELINVWVYGHHKVKFQKGCTNGNDPNELRKLNWGPQQRRIKSGMTKEHDPPVDMIVEEFEKMMDSGSWTVPRIKNYLNKCSINWITKKKNAELFKEGWSKKRPKDAYKRLKINLV